MSGQWHGGKGSSPRKTSLSQDEWDNRWNAIFRRDLPPEPDVTQEQPQPVAEQKDTTDTATK
jgi:hypothetical protein